MAESVLVIHGKLVGLPFDGSDMLVTTDDNVVVGSIVYTTNGGTSRVRLFSRTTSLIDVPSSIEYASYTLTTKTKICYCLQSGSIGDQVLVKVLN